MQYRHQGMAVDDRGSIPRMEGFSRPALGPKQPPVRGYRGLSSGLKRPRLETDH